MSRAELIERAKTCKELYDVSLKRSD